MPVQRPGDKQIRKGPMQTHNLKLPKNYRDTASDFYIKVGIGLIAILIILNVTLLILFLKEIKDNRNAQRVIQETGKSLAMLQDSLGRTDVQKAFVHLADARRQIAAALPPAPAAPPVKAVAAPPAQPAQPAKTAAAPKAQPEKQPAAELKAPAVPVKAEPKAPAVPVKAAEFVMPAGETPVPLVWAVTGEYALIGEKESKLLHLFKFQDDRFVLVKSYPCIIGANGEDKKKAGDFATPKGSYFTLRYTPGSALPEIYGEGAFVLNYPNFLDRKDSKQGAGIWIHGHVPGKVIGAGDLVNTKGCIAVSNDNIKELKGLLKPSGTPVAIVDKVAFVKESVRKESVQEIRTFMDAWRQAWESGNTAKYLGYYSKDFTNSEGMRYEAFRRHKERVNSSKKFIRVNVDQMAVIFPQEREGQIAVVRFIQKYRSNNFESNSKKLFYLKKVRGGWTIFGESAF
jgi:murein L,D-transpeptidase YafK